MTSLNKDLLVSLVDDFLEPFGLDSELDSDFGYDLNDDTIYFSLLITERSDKLFKEYIEKTFHFIVPNIFIISLLHEVGHYFTLYSFSKMKLKNAHQTKELIENELEKITTDDPLYDIVYSKYFDLNIEKAATAWAIDYYKNNKARCDEFYSLFEKNLHEEFKRVGLTE